MRRQNISAVRKAGNPRKLFWCVPFGVNWQYNSNGEHSGAFWWPTNSYGREKLRKAWNSVQQLLLMPTFCTRIEQETLEKPSGVSHVMCTNSIMPIRDILGSLGGKGGLKIKKILISPRPGRFLSNYPSFGGHNSGLDWNFGMIRPDLKSSCSPLQNIKNLDF